MIYVFKIIVEINFKAFGKIKKNVTQFAVTRQTIKRQKKLESDLVITIRK